MKSKIILALAVLTTIESALAATVYNDPSAFLTAVGSASVYTLPVPTDFAGQFTNTSNPVVVGDASYAGNNGLFAYNDGGYGEGIYYLAMFGTSLDISISGEHNNVGFSLGNWYYGDNSGLIFSLAVNGGEAQAYSVAVFPNSTFFGIANDSPITSLTITSSAPTELDIVGRTSSSTSAVPEASTSLGLLALGAGGLLTRRRTSRKA